MYVFNPDSDRSVPFRVKYLGTFLMDNFIIGIRLENLNPGALELQKL